MKLNLKELPANLIDILKKLRHFAVFGFILLVVAVYGFLVVRINSLQQVAPSSSQPVKVVVTPRIDPKLVKQLQQLHDNSVSVKSLFDQARSNPFQE